MDGSLSAHCFKSDRNRVSRQVLECCLELVLIQHLIGFGFVSYYRNISGFAAVGQQI